MVEWEDVPTSGLSLIRSHGPNLFLEANHLPFFMADELVPLLEKSGLLIR